MSATTRPHYTFRGAAEYTGLPESRLRAEYARAPKNAIGTVTEGRLKGTYRVGNRVRLPAAVVDGLGRNERQTRTSTKVAQLEAEVARLRQMVADHAARWDALTASLTSGARR